VKFGTLLEKRLIYSNVIFGVFITKRLAPPTAQICTNVSIYIGS